MLEATTESHYSPTRRFPRFPVELTVICVDGERKRADRVTDLSEEGARIETLVPLVTGAHLHFYFIIPDALSRGMIVDIGATIAWSKDHSMGVHFDHHFAAVGDYVSRLASLHFRARP